MKTENPDVCVEVATEISHLHYSYVSKCVSNMAPTTVHFETSTNHRFLVAIRRLLHRF